MKHPHERGEDGRGLARQGKARETPPRAWGRPFAGANQKLHEGNTPTSVGKTGVRGREPVPCQKHPHERGEDTKAGSDPGLSAETPPRAWGRRFPHLLAPPPVRNTPTSVGKTMEKKRGPGNPGKHPHERGEDFAWVRGSPSQIETPPRAWGRPQAGAASGFVLRNTPTSVGKTAAPMTVAASCWKHPHERGEDVLPAAVLRWTLETPPRAWGRRESGSSSRKGVGNTPTSVGKTAQDGVRVTMRRKHPHERGEDNSSSMKDMRTLETPPRAWGRPCCANSF